jgi:Bacterial Ig-like domain (group 3)
VVTNTSGSGGTPTGTVDFMTGTTLIGSGTLGANGTVSITTSQSAGTYPIVADYLGATDFQSSHSSTVTLTVNALPSTTTITSTPASPTFGQSGTFTAVIAGSTGGPAPTGMVTFLANSLPLGTAPVTAGQASLTTYELTSGSFAITAAYSGDSTYGPSTSAVAAITVAKAPSTTSLSSSANPAAQGQAVTYTAVVSDNAIPPPQGTVTFLDGTTVLGTAPLNFNSVTNEDVATFTTSVLPAGAHTITASYSGDANVLASTSTALTQQVNSSAIVDGPTVTNLQRFGFHAQPTMLVLTFSEALNPTQAQNVANYVVTGGSVTYTVSSAVYNPANNTVTLHFSQKLNVHNTYTITVNGTAPNGLTSAGGALLDGANTGKPGSNYVNTFGMEILAGTAADAVRAPSMLKLEQFDHGHITSRAIHELVTQGGIKIQSHHHRRRGH